MTKKFIVIPGDDTKVRVEIVPKTRGRCLIKIRVRVGVGVRDS
jgi:hypothetical protein